MKQPAPQTRERGDISRQKLVEAALEIFGQYGFEATSTRQLAKAAKVNIAAIPYYFGGKEGLYFAAVDAIVERFKKGMGHSVELINQQLKRKNITRAECRELLQQFITEMTKFTLGSDTARMQSSRIVTREQLDPTPAFDRLYRGVISELHTTLALLFSRITSVPLTDPEMKLKTQALLGQIIAFKSSRETVLRNMKWKNYGEKEIAKVTRVIQFNVDAIIDAYLRKK